MSKRKTADDHNPGGDSDGAKKPRTDGAAAAQADPSDGKGSIEVAGARPDLAPRIAFHTLKLMDAINSTDGGYTQRMQTVVDLLKADADRHDSLIDLSLVVEGERSCLLFYLLRFFDHCIDYTGDADDVKADKRAAEALIHDKMPHLQQKLLRSFDPATVDASTGNNALHEVCRLFTLDDVDDWPFKLTELLIDRGVSEHARNKEGRTPLLLFACTGTARMDSATGLRLLLTHGSDPNAQDDDGNGVLHLLVKTKAATVLDSLFDGEGAIPLNFTLRNSAGETAADLAAVRLAQKADSGAGCLERRVHRLVAMQTAMWIKHAQPALLGHSRSMLPQADAAAANSADPLLAALARAKLAPRIALHTLKLVDAIKKSDGSYQQRMQTVADLIKADAARIESLVDLSLVPEGAKSCVLFQLLKLFWDCTPDAGDADDVKADRRTAQHCIYNHALPLLPKLLRSFDPTTVDASTGNNALHELGSLFSLDSVNGWSYELAQLLFCRGVDVNARNKAGRTPLLLRAALSSKNASTASGLRMLLAHGSDLNAQDGEGDGVLHHLVKRQAETTLEDLIGGELVSHLDWALRNNAGQTAANLAAVQLAQLADNSADSPQKRIHRLMMAQTAMWTKHARPVLLRCLESALPVADVAKLALGYIDGSGLPFTAAAEAESDEEAEPAAAVAAQS